MSIGKLAAGQESYYLELAAGVEDYYTTPEAPGSWTASSSRLLGLSQQVDAEDLRAVLAGRHPATGESLSPSNRRVPGFDLTLSAPKSVSVLYALGPDAIPAVVDAHGAAVTAALGYLERHACVVRRGHDGVEQLAGDGLVAAAFRHHTSRAGDPQLHSHVLVANLSRGPDGRWSALDGRALYRHARTAGALYRSQLRFELGQRLGIGWSPQPNGIPEVAGVPASVRSAFSRRRAEISAHLAERGVSGVAAARVATLATRAPKDPSANEASLTAEWRERAAALGYEPRHVAALMGLRDAPTPPPVPDEAFIEGLTLALTERRSMFEHRDVEGISPSGGRVVMTLAGTALPTRGERRAQGCCEASTCCTS